MKSILADPLIAAKSERAVRCVASRLALGTRSMWELQGETSAAPWRNVGATRGVAIGFGRA